MWPYLQWLVLLGLLIYITVQVQANSTQVNGRLNTLEKQQTRLNSSLELRETKSSTSITVLDTLKSGVVSLQNELDRLVKAQKVQHQSTVQYLSNQAFLTTAMSHQQQPEDYPEDIRVAVLIPVYNGHEYLRECLESVQNQTRPPEQVLVGINGHDPSSDTVAILEQVCEEFMDVLPLEVTVYAQGGKVRTLHRLLEEKVTTNFVAMLDVDDTWLPEKLELQIEILQQYQVSVVGSNCVYHGDMSGSPNIPAGILKPIDFLTHNPIINSSIVMLTDLAHWDTDGLEDYELWLRLVRQGHVFYNLAEPLVYHRVHKDSAFNVNPYVEKLSFIKRQHQFV